MGESELANVQMCGCADVRIMPPFVSHKRHPGGDAFLARRSLCFHQRQPVEMFSSPVADLCSQTATGGDAFYHRSLCFHQRQLAEMFSWPVIASVLTTAFGGHAFIIARPLFVSHKQPFVSSQTSEMYSVFDFISAKESMFITRMIIRRS